MIGDRLTSEIMDPTKRRVQGIIGETKRDHLEGTIGKAIRMTLGKKEGEEAEA